MLLGVVYIVGCQPRLNEPANCVLCTYMYGTGLQLQLFTWPSEAQLGPVWYSSLQRPDSHGYKSYG